LECSRARRRPIDLTVANRESSVEHVNLISIIRITNRYIAASLLTTIVFGKRQRYSTSHIHGVNALDSFSYARVSYGMEFHVTFMPSTLS
jgi:hypothetical protein